MSAAASHPNSALLSKNAAACGSRGSRGQQRSSEVSRGQQRSSEVISGHQRPSEVSRGQQRS